MNNPFVYGNPVDSDLFFGCKTELRQIVSRILNQGQSTAIVGEPKIGKTSLLNYLMAEENLAALYGNHAANPTFCYMDAQTLGGQFTQTQFWDRALKELANKGAIPADESSLAKTYEFCQENHFDTFSLQKFFTELSKVKGRLVLLLDEFDLLLLHPVLNDGEFFGSLRGLASNLSKHALVIITSSRQSLSQLNEKTQAFNPSGSPYFNFMAETTLASFEKTEMIDFLQRVAPNKFNGTDLGYLYQISGGHPYLVQASAACLWDNSDYMLMSHELYGAVRFHFGDTWRVYATPTRQVLTFATLVQINGILGNQEFALSNLRQDLNNLGPEIGELTKARLIVKKNDDYHVAQGAMLWWLADELLKTVRPDKSFEQWLKDEQLVGGVMTQERVNQLSGVAKHVGGLLNEGAATLIKAMAEGAVKAVVG